MVSREVWGDTWCFPWSCPSLVLVLWLIVLVNKNSTVQTIPHNVNIAHLNTTISHLNTTISQPYTTILHPNLTISQPKTTISHPTTTISHPNSKISHPNKIIFQLNITISHLNTTISFNWNLKRPVISQVGVTCWLRFTNWIVLAVLCLLRSRTSHKKTNSL